MSNACVVVTTALGTVAEGEKAIAKVIGKCSVAFVATSVEDALQLGHVPPAEVIGVKRA